jgi:hypothetical protein
MGAPPTQELAVPGGTAVVTVPSQAVDELPARSSAPRRRLEPALIGGRLGLGVMALGLLVIGLGWFGISGTGARIDGATDVRAQLPYLLSGGFLGLALVVVGAALLVAQTVRVERARTEALLEARFDQLTGALGGYRLPTAPEGWVVAGAAAYHRADCRLVDADLEAADYVSVETAEASGLRPCRVCLRERG